MLYTFLSNKALTNQMHCTWNPAELTCNYEIHFHTWNLHWRLHQESDSNARGTYSEVSMVCSNVSVTTLCVVCSNVSVTTLCVMCRVLINVQQGSSPLLLLLVSGTSPSKSDGMYTKESMHDVIMSQSSTVRETWKPSCPFSFSWIFQFDSSKRSDQKRYLLYQ